MYNLNSRCPIARQCQIRKLDSCQDQAIPMMIATAIATAFPSSREGAINDFSHDKGIRPFYQKSWTREVSGFIRESQAIMNNTWERMSSLKPVDFFILVVECSIQLSTLLDGQVTTLSNIHMHIYI